MVGLKVNMRSLRAMNVGIRSQAIMILALIALWYWSFVLLSQDIKVGRLGLVWHAMFWLLPFIAGVFAIIILISFGRNGRRHQWWVWLAAAAAISPWLVLFLTKFLASAGFL